MGHGRAGEMLNEKDGGGEKITAKHGGEKPKMRQPRPDKVKSGRSGTTEVENGNLARKSFVVLGVCGQEKLNIVIWEELKRGIPPGTIGGRPRR